VVCCGTPHVRQWDQKSLTVDGVAPQRQDSGLVTRVSIDSLKHRMRLLSRPLFILGGQGLVVADLACGDVRRHVFG
jgi:hypothetical protein